MLRKPFRNQERETDVAGWLVKDVKQRATACVSQAVGPQSPSGGGGSAAASFGLLPGDSSLQAKADWYLERIKARYCFPPLKERPGRQSQAVLGAQAFPCPVLIKGLLTAPEPQAEHPLAFLW